MNLKINYRILLLLLFSIAMGYMESAVVVYLREIYYPNGFAFPLQPIDKPIAFTEIFREAATIIMLLSIGIFAGRTKTEKFGFFIFAFGIWDIFYYLFLYIILGWPGSLMTWDILFLIPVTWAGPVIGPVINSLSMIVLALLISYFTTKDSLTRLHRNEWWLLGTGSLIVIISYVENYVYYLMQEFSLTDLVNPSKSEELMDYAAQFVPEHFTWWIFILGQLLIFSAIINFYIRKNRLA
jgi:hypothetical protein